MNLRLKWLALHSKLEIQLQREIKGDKLNELFAVIEAQPKGARAFFDNVISRAYFNSGGKRRYVENVKVKDFNIKLR